MPGLSKRALVPYTFLPLAADYSSTWCSLGFRLEEMTEMQTVAEVGFVSGYAFRHTANAGLSSRLQALGFGNQERCIRIAELRSAGQPRAGCPHTDAVTAKQARFAPGDAAPSMPAAKNRLTARFIGGLIRTIFCFTGAELCECREQLYR